MLRIEQLHYLANPFGEWHVTSFRRSQWFIEYQLTKPWHTCNSNALIVYKHGSLLLYSTQYKALQKKNTCPQPNWWPQRLQYVLLSSDMHKRKPWINGLSSTPQPFLTYPNQNDTCLFLTRMALILGTVFAQYWCKKSCTVQAPNGAEFTHHVHIQMGLHENTQITWMIRSWKIRLTYL